MAKSPSTNPPTRRIRLVAAHLLAVGPYLYGQDYEVSAAEAARLVPDRGFIDVDEPAVNPLQPPIEDPL